MCQCVVLKINVQYSISNHIYIGIMVSDIGLHLYGTVLSSSCDASLMNGSPKRDFIVEVTRLAGLRLFCACRVEGESGLDLVLSSDTQTRYIILYGVRMGYVCLGRRRRRRLLSDVCPYVSHQPLTHTSRGEPHTHTHLEASLTHTHTHTHLEASLTHTHI